jgi:hypothetical protein
MSDQGSQDERRSIALVDRLLQVEERVHGLVRENLNLQRDLASGQSHRSSSGAAFDVPRTAHEWPLADDASLLPEDLDLYDRRCDDDVVLAGRNSSRCSTCSVRSRIIPAQLPRSGRPSPCCGYRQPFVLAASPMCPS